MSDPRVLLLAREADFHRLRCAGGLSTEALGPAAFGDDEDASPMIGWLDPALGIATPPAGATPDAIAQLRREQDEFFASLLGATVCHLLILDAHDDPAVLDLAIGQQRQFATSLARSVAEKHTAEIRHVLILVFTEDLPTNVCRKLNDLIAAFAPEPRVYLMLRQLELGGNIPHHSFHVWPVYVARLLTCIAQKPDRFHSAGMFAWRCFEIAPAPDTDAIEAAQQQAFDYAFRELTRATDGTYAPITFDLEDHHFNHPAAPAELGRPAQAWQNLDATAAAAAAADDQRWEPTLKNAGEATQRQRYETAIGYEEEGARERPVDHAGGRLRAVWESVRTSPANLFRPVEVAPQHRTPQDLADDFKHLAAAEDARRVALARTAECATEYDNAARSYVTRKVRLIFIAAVAVYACWKGWFLTRGFASVWEALSFSPPTQLLSWWAPLVVGGAGIAGAMFAGLAGWYFERWRGERAEREFHDAIAVADEHMARRHKQCVQLIEHSVESWMGMRLRALRGNLELLLRRTRTVVENELQPSVAALARAEPALAPDDATVRSGGQSRVQRERQLAKAREVTSILVPAATGDARPVVGGPEFDALLEAAVHSFREQWLTFTIRHDPRYRGNLPAGRLISLIEDFREKLKADIHRHLAGRRLDLYQPRALADHLEAEFSQRNLRDTGFAHFASCVMPDGAEFHRTFYFHPRCIEPLRAITACAGCEPLRGAFASAAFGYVFEESAIELAGDGHVQIRNRGAANA